jgi:Domain of unknown function (DUF4352)
MDLPKLLLLGVAGWTALGAIGITISLVRGRHGVPGERERLRRGLWWIAGVWVLYMGVLLCVSLVQRQRVVTLGQEQCFGKMCFTVTGIETVPGLTARDQNRLMRISVRVTNRGDKALSEGSIKAYLVDGQGRRWEEAAAVSGVRLTTTVAAGSSVVSEPLFQVARDATGLALVFTQGSRQPGVLVIGDSDSLLHRRTVVALER